MVARISDAASAVPESDETNNVGAPRQVFIGADLRISLDVPGSAAVINLVGVTAGAAASGDGRVTVQVVRGGWTAKRATRFACASRAMGRAIWRDAWVPVPAW